MGGSDVAPQYLTIGLRATRPEPPTKEGYTFDNWYVGDSQTAFSFNTLIKNDLVLTAKWAEIVN